MIREATHSDIPAIMEMGKQFADEAGVSDRIGWSDDAVFALLSHLVESPDGILLVGEKGMIGGLVYPHPYSGNLIFQEMFWRSHGFEGVKLLKAAERAAKKRGARHSVMLGMDSLPDTARLYSRMGYAPLERLYSKEI